jgi:hypothetical protein
MAISPVLKARVLHQQGRSTPDVMAPTIPTAMRMSHPRPISLAGGLPRRLNDAAGFRVEIGRPALTSTTGGMSGLNAAEEAPNRHPLPVVMEGPG